MQAKIVTCGDIEHAKDEILSTLNPKQCKLYMCDEFKVDDAKAVTKEAYISEEKEKYLIIVATSYRIEAQNALLKLLEEPPRNIVFILICKSKTALLPTIRSRMKIESIVYDKPPFELSLELSKMELLEIFTFLKEKKNISKAELKETIQALLRSALIDHDIALSEKEMTLFEHALLLCELNSRPQNILSVLLLTLYHARGKRREA